MVPPPSTPTGTYVHVVRKGELLGEKNTFKAKILTKLFKSFTSGRPSGETQSRVEVTLEKCSLFFRRNPNKNTLACVRLKGSLKKE